jgi:tetratricopeptide (TPR) repeat protein
VVDSARNARWDRWLGEACFALGDLAASARYSMQSLDQLGQSLPSSVAGWSATISLGIARQTWSRVVRSQRLPGWLRRSSDPDPDPRLVDAALASARMTSYYFFNNDSLGLLGASLQAINLAERADQRVPVAEIYSQLGYVAHLAKLRPVSRGYFAKARATAKATRDSSGLAWAYFGEAASTLCTAQWSQARLAAGKGLAIAESLRNPQDIEVAQTLLGHCEFVAGDYPAAMIAARALYTSAQQRANRQHEAWGLYTQARVALYRGDLDEAIADFERALQLLVGVSDQASQILCGGMLACALARAGRLAPARIAADDATARIDGRTPPVFTISEGFVCTAEAYLELWRRGDPGVQPAALLAVRNLARLARLLPIASSAAATLMGMVHLRSGQPARARRSLRRGLAIAEGFALPYDQAVAHHGLALAADNGARLRHHAAAQRLFARLGCRWHLQHLYADAGPLGGELAGPGRAQD